MLFFDRLFLILFIFFTSSITFAQTLIPWDYDQVCSKTPPPGLATLWPLKTTTYSAQMKDGLLFIIEANQENDPTDWEDLGIAPRVSFCFKGENSKVESIRYSVNAMKTYLQLGMVKEAEEAKQNALSLFPLAVSELSERDNNSFNFDSDQMNSYMDDTLGLGRRAEDLNNPSQHEYLDEKGRKSYEKWADKELDRLDKEMKADLANGETLTNDRIKQVLDIIRNKYMILEPDDNAHVDIGRLSNRLYKSMQNHLKQISCPPTNYEIVNLLDQARKIEMASGDSDSDGGRALIEKIVPYFADYARYAAPEMSTNSRIALAKAAARFDLNDMADNLLNGRDIGKPKCKVTEPSYWIGNITLTREYSYSNDLTSRPALGEGVQKDTDYIKFREEISVQVTSSASTTTAEIDYDTYQKSDRTITGQIECFGPKREINYSHNSTITNKGHFLTGAKVTFRGGANELKIFVNVEDSREKPIKIHEVSSETGNVGCETPVNKNVDRTYNDIYVASPFDFVLDKVLEDVTEISKTYRIDKETTIKVMLKKINPNL